MKNKIRLEDFPTVNYCSENGNYYAYNSNTGECAIFNIEKKLLFHSCFSPGGELNQYAHIQSEFPPGLNWAKGDILAIAWHSATTHEVIKFGLYNIKTKSYVLPIDNWDNYCIRYSYTHDETAVFFKSSDSLFIIDNNGNLVGKLSKCEYFETKFYDFESQTVIVGEKRKTKCGCEYEYGVYSCKEKRMIIPVKFDKIQNYPILGFIVTKNEQMGIYSYEGEILTELAFHYIEPLYAKIGPSSKTLVKIRDKVTYDTGVFTLNHKCIIPMKYRDIFYHSDEFIIAQNHNLSWTVYSVSKRKPLVPPCIGVKIGKFGKDDMITIHATKYLQLEGHSGYTVEEEGSIDPTYKTIETYNKNISPHYKYHICYDVYSIDGELIEKDVIDTISTSIFSNPYNDLCVESSFNETR